MSGVIASTVVRRLVEHGVAVFEDGTNHENDDRTQSPQRPQRDRLYSGNPLTIRLIPSRSHLTLKLISRPSLSFCQPQIR